MAGYSASNLLGGTQQAVSSSYKSLLALMASSGTSLQRFAVFEFVFGLDGTPADNALTWDVSRITADGTATSITPNKLDPADGAFLGVGKANYTAEPTVTANSSVWPIGMNQRATHRWVSFPGQELIAPATDANGFAFRVKSTSYTGTATALAHFRNT